MGHQFTSYKRFCSVNNEDTRQFVLLGNQNHMVNNWVHFFIHSFPSHCHYGCYCRLLLWKDSTNQGNVHNVFLTKMSLVRIRISAVFSDIIYTCVYVDINTIIVWNIFVVAIPQENMGRIYWCFFLDSGICFSGKCLIAYHRYIVSDVFFSL